MNKNLVILIAVGLGVAFVIWKMMKLVKEQSEIIKSQTDVLMAVAVKTGAVVPAETGKKIASKNKSGKKDSVESRAAASNDNPEQPPLPPKNVVLTVAHKRLIKLFDDQVPKTASQLRVLYNKVASIQLDAKKFNSLLWNIRNNKKLITYEKLEDSDSVWGLIEWFEIDGDTAKLTDEFFNRIPKA